MTVAVALLLPPTRTVELLPSSSDTRLVVPLLEPTARVVVITVEPGS